MRRVIHVGLVAMVAIQVVVVGQGQDVARILADVRAALGGEAKLAGVKTLMIEGQSTRSRPDGTSQASPLDMAFEFPGKFSRRDVVGNFNGVEIARLSGFNGDGLVESTEVPPQLGGGHMLIRSTGGGMPGAELTPEQQARQREMALAANKADFARLSLGMFATSFPSYPVEFTYAGLAQSADAKAHVIEVKGAGDFAVKLFVDTTTHLPLMLSWMAREPMPPMTMTMGPGGPQMAAGGGNAQMRVVGTPSGKPPTPEEMAKIRADMEAQIAAAEARRRVVEYRLFYSGYKAFDGVRLPTRIQRMVDGEPTDEMEFEKIKVNGKVDPKRFDVVK